MKFRYNGIGRFATIGFSFILLTGCTIQGPNPFSYKTSLAEKEKSITGFNEAMISETINNPYADKVEKKNIRKIVYYQKPTDSRIHLKKLSQKELKRLYKISNEKAKHKPNGNTKLGVGSKLMYAESIKEAIKETQKRDKKLVNARIMKIDPTNKKEKPITLKELQQELDAKMNAYE